MESWKKKAIIISVLVIIGLGIMTYFLVNNSSDDSKSEPARTPEKALFKLVAVGNPNSAIENNQILYSTNGTSWYSTGSSLFGTDPGIPEGFVGGYGIAFDHLLYGMSAGYYN